MNAHTFRMAGCAMALALMTTGCIDSDYDLSDINTDASISVNNLTLPVNIDKITLDNILDLDSTSKIKVVDNEYAFVSDGSFTSDVIRIPQVVAQPSGIQPSKATLPLTSSGNSRTITVPELSSSFIYTDSSVSESIMSISEAAVTFSLRLQFSLPSLAGKGAQLSLTNLKVNLPKGWIPAPEAGTYNASESTLSISGVTGKDDHTVSADIAITRIKVTDNFSFNPTTHTITLADNFGIAEAGITITSSSPATLPAQAELTLDYLASPLTVTAFSGEINYKYSGLDVESITLSDLPSLLTQPGTNIKIANPQLYLNVENPLYKYSLKGRTDLRLTSVWSSGEATVHSLDQGSFTIGSNQFNPYCLSPIRPASFYKGYDGASYVAFSSLSDVLSGDGLPAKIDISLADAEIFTQPVAMLPLGVDLGCVKGDYTIFAPLALNAGSTILYSHTETGWNDEDVDAITITQLKVTANITTDLPANIHIVAFPLDKEGHVIPGTEITGADISGPSTDKPIVITLTGEIKHLDGVEIQAVATATDGRTPLSPQQSIILSNIRATVSGNYTKKL